MSIKFLSILICSLVLVACVSADKKIVEAANSCETNATTGDRAVATALACEDLFKPKVQIHIIDNDVIKTEKKAVREVTFALMNEVVPKSMDETFWKVVEQISRNENTRIRLDSDSIVLTKAVNENLKLHTTYVYEPTTDIFVLKKIEYTEKNRDKKELTSEPLLKNSNQLRKDLSLKISELTSGPNLQTVGIPASISHAIYKKVEAELKNFSLFTTHELLTISQLSPKTRLAKYQFLLAGRKIRNFIVRDFMEELIKKPIKTIVISVVSVAIISHTDFVKNIVSIKNTTPEWVAPSVVKMAGRYPEHTQAEIIYLMKEINNSNKESVKIFENRLKTEKKLVNIDDVDQFTIQSDPTNKKTYFVMSHENQNGTMDVYSVEIDPARYPRLAERAEIASADAQSK